MILTGAAILDAVEAKRISIEPFDPERLNPASYDLTLGDTVRVYRAWTHDCHEAGCKQDGQHLYSRDGIHDIHQAMAMQSFRIDPDIGWVLKAGIGYLMHTVERIHTDHYVPILDGKSSLARLFMKVHETAGYCDPGFDGQVTLDVTVMHPLRVFPGMRVCQVRFHIPEGKVVLYKGHYVGDKAIGPVGSEAHDMFWLPVKQSDRNSD